MIDFTKPHPRTVAWWTERELCLRCAHLRRQPGKSTWWCSVVPAANGRKTCIDAREPGHRCGPEGRLFKAAR